MAKLQDTSQQRSHKHEACLTTASKTPIPLGHANKYFSSIWWNLLPQSHLPNKSGKPWNDIDINRAKTFAEGVLIMISVGKRASSQLNILHMKRATWQTSMAQGAVLNVNILQTISVKFYLRFFVWVSDGINIKWWNVLIHTCLTWTTVQASWILPFNFGH